MKTIDIKIKPEYKNILSNNDLYLVYHDIYISANNLLLYTNNDEVSYDDIINKFLSKSISKMVEIDFKKHKEEIKNNILKSFYLKDIAYFDNDILKKIKFEPFTTIFETSGKIIVENDLRNYFNECDFDINKTKGIIKTMQHYANQKMLHGFVGNSCPSLFLSLKHNELYIGAKYDENKDEYILPDDTYKEIANVCTDLWWYSIVDLEYFKKKNPNVDVNNFQIVEIPAGKWELTHKYGISEKGYHENLPYAIMKLM